MLMHFGAMREVYRIRTVRVHDENLPVIVGVGFVRNLEWEGAQSLPEWRLRASRWRRHRERSCDQQCSRQLLRTREPYQSADLSLDCHGSMLPPHPGSLNTKATLPR